MRIAEFCIIQAQQLGVLVHFPNEGLELKFGVSAAEKVGTHPVGQLIRRIVTTGQHKSIEQFLDSVLVTLDKFSRCASDIECLC
jgi:hypothetical protein